MSRTILRFLFVCLLAGGFFSLGAAAQAPASNGAWDYRLLATNKTSTMQKEMNEAADAGFRFQGVMGGETSFGGSEVVVIFAKSKDAAEKPHYKYILLATNKTSTMQKEMQEAGEAGYRFVCVMGGETSFGGNEVVLIMGKAPDAAPRFEYRLLATSKTSTMQKELQEASDAGFEFRGQTVFKSTFGGKEVAVILERDREAEPGQKFEYLLLATKKTSTMQKEIKEVADQGYQVVGMAVGETLLGGNELVTITRRPRS